MKIEAIKIKEWCDKNLTTVAWQRIVVKVSPQFRGTGLTLTKLLNPDASIVLDDQQYRSIKEAIEETYQVSVAIMV